LLVGFLPFISMKREREPTKEEFEKLLAWLASAGREYGTMHHRLIRIFLSRGCIDAENLADEVMNRVAVRIDKVVTTYEGDPAKCFQGFLENVYLEYLRDQRLRSNIEPLEPLPDHGRDQEKSEREDDCLTECLGELTPGECDLFRRYFQEEKRAKINARKRLAAELRLTANALRIKAHRIRQRSRKCMEACLESLATPETIRS
jgi:RNA polymerase sigma factor (sigma-70 family)